MATLGSSFRGNQSFANFASAARARRKSLSKDEYLREAARRARARWRRIAIMIHAVSRMKRLRRPRLTFRERLAFARMYEEAGALKHPQEVMQVISNAGFTIGMEELTRWIESFPGHKPGRVISAFQFQRLGDYLKARFEADQQMTDAKVAFIALAGDDENEVDADKLRAACRHFNLTIDIDKFIQEHDTSGDGGLDEEEFNALFEDDHDEALQKAADAAAENEQHGHGHHRAPGHHHHHAPADLLAQQRLLSDKKDADGDAEARPSHGHGDGAGADGRGRAHEASPQALGAIIEQWARSEPEGLGGSPRRRRRRDKASSKDGSKTARKPLWEPTHPAEMPAKERLALLTEQTSPRTTFSTARRFDFVAAVAPPGGEQSASTGPQQGNQPLPPLTSRKRDPNAPRRWYERDPFGGTSHSAQASPSPSPRSTRKDLRQYERQKLPVIARNAKGQSVLVQPEMQF